jgi:hypothetical protein
MERRRSQNYLGTATCPSFAKSSSSSVAKSFRKNHTSKNQFVSKHSKLLHTPSIPHPHYKKILRKISSSTQPNSLKRSHDDDDKGRPFKKQLVEVTGLEDDPLVEVITVRSTSTITTSQIELYARRKKVANYASEIQRKKAMVSPIVKLPTLILLTLYIE